MAFDRYRSIFAARAQAAAAGSLMSRAEVRGSTQTVKSTYSSVSLFRFSSNGCHDMLISRRRLLRSALSDALLRLFGTHWRKLSSIVTLLLRLSLKTFLFFPQWRRQRGGGRGEASPLWVDVQKLCNMCVLSLSRNFFVSHDKYQTLQIPYALQ